jgi:hypothetical protein
MAVLFVAGILKGADAIAFMQSLSTWEFLPRSMIPLVSLVLPPLEIGVAFSWFLGVRRRPMEWIAIALLASFTIVFTVHVLFAAPPDCGCFAMLQLDKQGRSQMSLLIVRNGALIILLLVSRFAHRSAGGPHAIDSSAPLPSI